MKKQIFILVFLVVAVFASVTKSYGQTAIAPMAGAVTAPRAFLPAFDVSNPMTPIAGRPYTYSAVIDPVGGQAYWYATKSTTFMTAGVRSATELPASATSIIPDATTGNYMTKAVAGTSPTSTTITWSSDVLSGVDDGTAKPLFMVVEYNGPAPCTTSNNVKVMQIIPKNAFTIDLTNMAHGNTPTPKAYGATESQCYAGLVSSIWAKATGLTNNYGADTLYFELIAANFSAAFKPTFQLTGLQSTQTADVKWDIAAGGTALVYANTIQANIAAAATKTTPITLTGTPTVATALSNTSGGVAIYIQVIVKNNGYEGLTADDITLAVDATDNSATPNSDVKPDGTAKGAFAELAFQTLNARPKVTAGTGVTFVTQVP